MKIFDGLYPFEMVLLVLGVLFFLVLLVAFALLVVRGKPFGKLFAFFVIPVAMVGFPGIKSIEFSNSVVKIEKATHELQANPTDKKLRESLDKELANVSARPLSNPQDSVTVARAQVALGNNAAAEENLKKALAVNPQLPEALELKKRIDLDTKLAELTSQAEQKPENAAVKSKLTNTVNEIVTFKTANPLTISNIARAQAVLGDQVKAQENVAKVLRINPKLAPIQLMNKPGISMVPPK
ncbi:MAG: hypothetical protein GJV46_09695 [Geobacter sp.]|nr:hypothetical protein [Geobacter sp.]